MRWFRRKSREPPAALDDSDDVRFFFYFEGEHTARAAAATLEAVGYGVAVTPPRPEIPQWSVIASGRPGVDDLLAADEAFIPWAASLGGEYDGSEQRVG